MKTFYRECFGVHMQQKECRLQEGSKHEEKERLSEWMSENMCETPALRARSFLKLGLTNNQSPSFVISY